MNSIFKELPKDLQYHVMDYAVDDGTPVINELKDNIITAKICDVLELKRTLMLEMNVYHAFMGINPIWRLFQYCEEHNIEIDAEITDWEMI